MGVTVTSVHPYIQAFLCYILTSEPFFAKSLHPSPTSLRLIGLIGGLISLISLIGLIGLISLIGLIVLIGPSSPSSP